ncbi:hypothetical protein OG763_10005 [Streptomyces sp. NBC_01230]|uniref:hypothetical protein n=1 Tax=unclassified Streptomyces TaxID=2593676 RepID=UPI00088DA05C|nr:MULTISPECIES: hypothetical protein [unclassified Streptomyces]WSQ26119.1 hypothetical protein OG763_10005 [Streptomyces sp. NBC_01230]SCZ16701.1 hypothetical protein SAMN02745898_11880 [Streptomyces sp. 136MFCol5.1]
MEPEIAALASSAGTTVVTLMATDAWQRLREGIASLWRREQAERAEAVAAELDATREDLLVAIAAGDQDVEGELQAEWQGRIRRFLTARPEVAEDLRRLLNEFGPGSETAPAGTQHATASGRARIYQAGRDQHISER